MDLSEPLVTNTELADCPEVRRDYPLLSRAILAGASQQIRNMATVGGNLLQRTRCPYYYDTAFACNKRDPGSGCPAATGFNRMHAIFGASDQCVAVQPSDMCVALAALDAVVEVEGLEGKREIPLVDFHRLPGNTPERDTNLEPGELITSVILPPLPMAKSGVYLKLRDRASYSFALISVAAAKQMQRPLKVVVSRRQMTANTGHRPPTEQVIRLGASKEGKLIAIAHEVKSATSPVDVYTEPCISVTPVMYSVPNLLLKQYLAVMNVGTPTFMRAPGENPGMWALESAMDELASALQLDPVELRLRNETQKHQRKGLPFSAKHFADCLKVGAERFGWQERPLKPRSLTRDGLLVGWGMAAATFPALRAVASVKVRLLPDGTAHILTAGNDMGTGAYTVVAITAAEILDLPVAQIRVEMGDSNLPDGGMAGGSQMTATLTPAVMAACQEVLKTAEVSTAQQAFEKLQELNLNAFEATATAAPGKESKQFAFQSWGAHFCEVSVDEEIGRLQVTRWVTVMNVGRVVNAKTATSQVRGAVIMGISQALMETGHLDPHTGYPVVSDLTTYHIAAHADIPRIDVTFVGEPDLNFNPMGARGLGEIGIVGVAPAIANALYHATGKRLRELPITPDKLIL